LHCLH